MTNAKNTDNTPAQAKSLLPSLEQAEQGIGLYVNANKKELICFKQEEAISTLSGKPLKLVDLFAYLTSQASQGNGLIANDSTFFSQAKHLTV